MTLPPRQAARALFPCPADGARAAINPPGFAWWRAPGAGYRLTIQNAAGRVVYHSTPLPDPVHLPSQTLPPGGYHWDVEACDTQGRVLARRGIWRITVPAGPPELPKALLVRVPEAHPRYIFLKPGRNLPPDVQEAADRALKIKITARCRSASGQQEEFIL